MLTEYVDAALRKARYEILQNKEGYFGKIPGFNGLWANEPTLEACRNALRDTLESWLLVKLRHDDRDLPVVGGVNLNTGRTKKRVA